MRIYFIMALIAALPFFVFNQFVATRTDENIALQRWEKNPTPEFKAALHREKTKRFINSVAISSSIFGTILFAGWCGVRISHVLTKKDRLKQHADVS